MSRGMIRRVARKAVVAGATAAVLGAGMVTVQVASDWRAASAPLDAAPVSASSINDAMAAQQARAQQLVAQIDQVAFQLNEIRSAVGVANGAIASQNGTAAAVGDQLKAAQSKLTALQAQLKSAQQRLAQLNAAAARQAALNAAAAKQRVMVTTSTTSGGGEPVDHGD